MVFYYSLLVIELPFRLLTADLFRRFSGGHTGEMVRLLSTLDFRRFSPRLYLVARTDDTSAKRVQHLECSKDSTADSVSIHMIFFTHTMRVCFPFETWVLFFQFQTVAISRSREVHQSWISTVISFMQSTLESIKIVLSYQPDLV